MQRAKHTPHARMLERLRARATREKRDVRQQHAVEFLACSCGHTLDTIAPARPVLVLRRQSKAGQTTELVECECGVVSEVSSPPGAGSTLIGVWTPEKDR